MPNATKLKKGFRKAGRGIKKSYVRSKAAYKKHKPAIKKFRKRTIKRAKKVKRNIDDFYLDQEREFSRMGVNKKLKFELRF